MSDRRPSDLPDQQVKDTGSLRQSEPVFLLVGRLRSAHGIQGEIAMDVYTDFPERLRPNRIVYLGDQRQPLRLDGVRWKGQLLLLSFQGIDDRDQALALRNQSLYVRVEDLPGLPEGEYYYYQLIGLKVIDESSQPVGVMTDIIETGANDVFVVKQANGSELLLPAIESVILGVNLERGEITVRPQVWD